MHRPQINMIAPLMMIRAVLHQRKPELSLAELEKQQAILRELAAKGVPYVLVSAEPSAEQVADTACREVALFLAQREERR